MAFQKQLVTKLMMKQKPVIGVRPAYVRLVKDGNAAIILSQIIYWNLPDNKGRIDKLFVEWEGYRWLNKSYADWSADVGLSVDQCKRAIKKLKKLGFIAMATRRTKDGEGLHIRITEGLEEALIGEFSATGTDDEALDSPDDITSLLEPIRAKLEEISEQFEYPLGPKYIADYVAQLHERGETVNSVNQAWEAAQLHTNKHGGRAAAFFIQTFLKNGGAVNVPKSGDTLRTSRLTSETNVDDLLARKRDLTRRKN